MFRRRRKLYFVDNRPPFWAREEWRRRYASKQVEGIGVVAAFIVAVMVLGNIIAGLGLI